MTRHSMSAAPGPEVGAAQTEDDVCRGAFTLRLPATAPATGAAAEGH